jgi:hypothetical protein
VRVPTSDPHTINACWFLFLLFAYLLVAEAASFDKKSYAGAIQYLNLFRQDIKKIFLLIAFQQSPNSGQKTTDFHVIDKFW